ncbi:MAG: hypothetical protein O7D95_07315, partial [Betaproteobacteria bacterium]|nr:hypothetical protein [Betaproteobacteria bacterium]
MNFRNHLTYPLVSIIIPTRTDATPNTFGWLLKSLLGIVILGLAFPTFADPSSSATSSTPIIKVAGNTNTILDDISSAITTSDLEAVPKAKFDWTKQPHYTKSPRPGGFVVPAGPKAAEYPGQYSLFDFVTGKERATKPVQPYSPFALQTTPAFDINFNYLEKPGHEEDLFDPVKRIHLGDDFLLSFGGQFWYRYMHE